MLFIYTVVCRGGWELWLIRKMQETFSPMAQRWANE